MLSLAARDVFNRESLSFVYSRNTRKTKHEQVLRDFWDGNEEKIVGGRILVLVFFQFSRFQTWLIKSLSSSRVNADELFQGCG
jgi:hypothetical protein